MFSIEAYGSTDVGLERKNNEDAFHFAPEHGLYVVCDGMGGHASGELASRITVDSMVKFVTESIHADNFRWPFQSPRATTLETRILDCGIRLANRDVYQQAQADPRHKGMGTTVVAMLLGKDQIGAVHVGDSRIYRVRDGEIRLMTEDHSLLNHYRRTRPMSDEEIRNFKGKNVIVRAVGLRDTVEPETHVWDYRIGDIYLLCTDGLTDLVDDDYISGQLEQAETSIKLTVTNLIQKALAAGGKDNVTVLVLRLDAGAGMEDATEEITALSIPAMEGMEDTSPGFEAIGEGGFWDHETLPGLETDALVTIRAGAPASESATSVAFDAPTLPGGAPIKVKVRDTPPAMPGLDDDTPDGEQPMPPRKKGSFGRTLVDKQPPDMPVGDAPTPVRVRRSSPELAETAPVAHKTTAEILNADTDKYGAVDLGLNDETPEAVPVVKSDGDQ